MKIVMMMCLSLSRPGPSVHILTSLIAALHEAGHAVHVIAQRADDGRGAPALPAPLASMPRVTLDAIPVKQTEKGAFLKRYIGQARYARAASMRLKAHRDADLVYVHSCNVLSVFTHYVHRLLPRAALVVNVQDIFPENAAMIGALRAGSAPYRAMAALQRAAYRRADAVITLSDDMKNTLSRAGADQARVHVIPLWSYGDDVTPVADFDNRFLREHPRHLNAFRALYAGNVGAMQNVSLILSAAERLSNRADIHFLIVGDGARRSALKADAQARGLENVWFYESVPPERAVDLYSMAGVNLITLEPGVIFTAFPSKTTTCFAVGRPVIAAVDADSAYAQLIAACDRCAVVDPRSAQALADAVAALADAPNRDGSTALRRLYQTQLSERTGTGAHLELFARLTGNKEWEQST